MRDVVDVEKLDGAGEDSGVYLVAGTSEQHNSGSAHYWLVVCWNFTSWQHLRSYQEKHLLATVHTHGNLIMLPHWEIRPLRHDLISHLVTLS